MPGHVHELECPGCGRVHVSLYTGTGRCWDHGAEWEYEQWGCSSCGLLTSLASEHCCYTPVPICRHCGGRLERWSGRVWFDQQLEDIEPKERFEGPCPGCGTTITLEHTTGLIGLWD